METNERLYKNQRLTNTTKVSSLTKQQINIKNTKVGIESDQTYSVTTLSKLITFKYTN